MKMLVLAIAASAGAVACSGRDAQVSPQPGDQHTLPPPTTTTTTLPSEGAVRGAGVPLTEGASNNCNISIDKDPVQAQNDDAIRWTASVDPNATHCKGKRLKIVGVKEIDCVTKIEIPNSTNNPLEDCEHDRDTGQGGKVRLVCSVVTDHTNRCYKYTIKVGNDTLDPEIEVEPGAIMERSSTRPGTARE